jgi:peptidoglycan/LPS O-acetylase OafA/YrhL
MRPEFPFLAAGATAIVGGAIREKQWPSEGAQAAIGTLVLVIFASATANSRIAPLVRALGLLLLLAAVMATVNAVNAAKKGKK